MLSYQHIYHAGCLADVHKHAVLCALLFKMLEKPKPLTYIETHAGRGFYDLNAPEAQKTGEAKAGILKIRGAGMFPKDHAYSKVLDAFQSKYDENIYPGSAAIAGHMLRPEDKIHLMEMHPQEVLHLRRNMRNDNAHIHQRDGYEGLMAISPPTPRRGLVFIDPSYEIKTEYEKMPLVINSLLRKWPVAVVCIWYPILPAQAHVQMVKKLEDIKFPKSAFHEVEFAPIHEKGMYGSGLYFINMPFGLENEIKKIEEFFRTINTKY